MLMILAPSKTQDFSGSFSSPVTQPALLQESEHLLDELQKLSVQDLMQLMKMSERLALQTRQSIDAFQLPFTPDNASPALNAFQGDVYSRIDVAAYGKTEMEYAQNHLRILSGLYGVLRPQDLMQPYRLEMGCKLANSRGKNLYSFWEEAVTEALNRTLATHQEPTVVNLASAEYSKVINKKALQGTLHQVDFKERKGEAYRVVAIHAKRARGRMVDFAIKNEVQTVEALKLFQEDGYVFRSELSKESYYLYTREESV